MLRRFKLFLFLGMIALFSSCETAINNEPIKILFAGDLLLDRGVSERIDHFGIDHLFRAEIDSLFKSNDIVIANLECPATEIEAPINKKFIFRADPEHLMKLRKHGITHLNMANNHSMDQGRKGLIDTKDNILKYDLIQTGFGLNHDSACEEQLITTSPRSVYLLSSLQVPSENWTFLDDQPCVCEESFENIALRTQRLRMEEENAVIIVQLHWGPEHRLEPITSQVQQAHELIDAGADCIIGHHSHTVQTIEIYKGKPIYYSIGNFIFDQDKPINLNGLMVQMEISKNETKFKNLPITIEQSIPHLDKLEN